MNAENIIQENTVQRNKARVRFAGLYLLSVALIVVLLAAFWDNAKPSLQGEALNRTTLPSKGEDGFFEADSFLHTQLTGLQQIEEKYNNSLVNSADTAVRAEESNAILTAQENLRRSIDSLEQRMGSSEEGAQNARLSSTIRYFRAALQNHRAINSVRKALASRGGGFSADQQKLFNLQNDLSVKDSKINDLQAQLQKAYAERDNKIAALQTQVQNERVSASAPGADPDLVKKNTNLRSALNAMENKNATLLGQNIGLRQENERLIVQLNSLRKSGGAQ